ncbi:hypothetical protein CYLTODRAFT_336377, partial [Cylindrobasidium torrendii FP15055 ss-10]
LDPSMRYLPEYLYMGGIYLGPDHVKAEELDHFARPVVEQFAEAWDPGLLLSRTATSSTPVVVETAIVLSVNDLPAARDIAGLMSHGSHFVCSMCDLLGQANATNTDFEKWRLRNVDEMRSAAHEWRDASNERRRKEIYNRTGVRWSSLWLLPYWDPTRMLVIDSMHCLLEGLVKFHCTEALRLGSETEKTPVSKRSGPSVRAFSITIFLSVLTEHRSYAYVFPGPAYSGNTLKPNDVVSVSQIHQLLTLSLEGTAATPLEKVFNRLHSANLPALQWVATSIGLRIDVPFQPPPDIAALRRTKQPAVCQDFGSATGTVETLLHVQEVIRNTQTPSWVNSVPKNYGHAAAGTIKADEWRLLSTVYLPIALVTLWGDDEGSQPDAGSSLLRVLDHSMCLFLAVTIACFSTASLNRAEMYRSLLKRWLDDLYNLFPHARTRKEKPNFHVAFHIYEFLLLFGPVMSWWTFPFERLIGALQKIPNNSHLDGPWERTIMQCFHRAGNLRLWLRREHPSQALLEIKRLFTKSFSLPAQEDQIMDDEDAAAEPQRKRAGPTRLLYKEYAHRRHNGFNFSRSSTHAGNANILYTTSAKEMGIVHAGSIEKMTVGANGKVKLSVRRQAPLPAGRWDPFSRFPALRAASFSTDIAGLDEISFDEVLSQAARYDYSHGRTVFLSLSRD